MPDLSSTVLLRVQTDQQALARVNQDIQQLRSTLTGVADVTSSLNSAAQQGMEGLNQIRDSAQGADKAVQGLQQSINDADKTINGRQLGRGLSEAGFLANRLGAPGIGGGLRVAGQATSAVSNLGPVLDVISSNIDKFGTSLQNTNGIIGTAANVGAQLGPSLLGVSAGFGSVLAVAAPVALAVGGIAAIIAVFNSALQEGRTAVKDAIAGLDEYYKVIQTGTTESIKAQIETLNTQLKAAQEELNQLQAPRAIHGVGDVLNNALNSALAPEIVDRIKQLQTTVTTTTSSIDGLNRALTSTQTAANDAEASYLKIIDTVTQGIKDANSWEVKRTDLIHAGNLQAVKDEETRIQTQMDANKESIRRLNDLISVTSDPKVLEKLHAALDQYQRDNDQLNTQYQDLTHNVEGLTSVIEAIDIFKKVAANTQAYNDETQKINEQRQLQDSRALQDFNTKQANDTADFHTKINREDADYTASRLDKLNKLYTEANSITTKADEEALKDLTDLSNQETKISQDTVAAIAKINRDAQETELDAAAKLDARTVAQTERRRKNQIDDANTSAEKQKQQLEADTKLKIEELKKSAEEERNQRLADGLQQIQDEDNQRAIQRQREIDDFNTKEQREKDQFQQQQDRQAQDRAIEDKNRYQEFIKQQAALTGHFAQMLTIQTNGQNQLQQAWNSFWNLLKIPNIATSPNAAPTPATVGYTTITSGTNTVTNADYLAAAASNPNEYSNLLTDQTNAYTYSQASASANSVFAPTVNTATFQAAGSNAYENFLTPLAGGMSFVPKDNFPALLHFGEAVLDKQDAELWRGMTGRGGSTTNTTNNSLNLNGRRVSRADKNMIWDMVESILEEELG